MGGGGKIVDTCNSEIILSYFLMKTYVVTTQVLCGNFRKSYPCYTPVIGDHIPTRE